MNPQAAPVPDGIQVERFKCPECYGTRLNNDLRKCETCKAVGWVEYVTCPVHGTQVRRDSVTGELLELCGGCLAEADHGVSLLEEVVG